MTHAGVRQHAMKMGYRLRRARDGVMQTERCGAGSGLRSGAGITQARLIADGHAAGRECCDQLNQPLRLVLCNCD
jgi:hypothetical protein